MNNKSQQNRYMNMAKKAFAATALAAGLGLGLSGCMNLPVDIDTRNIDDFGKTPEQRQAFFDRVEQAKTLTGRPLEEVLEVLGMAQDDFSKQDASTAARVALYIHLESLRDLEQADKVAARMENTEVLSRQFAHVVNRDSVRFHRLNTEVTGEQYTLHLVVNNGLLERISDSRTVKNERHSDSKVDDFLKTLLP